jgi:hypothetical protein
VLLFSLNHGETRGSQGAGCVGMGLADAGSLEDEVYFGVLSSGWLKIVVPQELNVSLCIELTFHQFL